MTVRRGRSVLPTGAAALVLAALLTSCTQPAPTPTATASAPEVTVSSAHPTSTPTPGRTETATFLRDPDSAPWGVTLVPDQSLLGHLTNIAFPVQLPRDGGPIEYAEGRAVEVGSEVVAYEVAPGDVYDFIARRFHLTNDGYLIVLNEVRRGEAAPLYAGDELNLSAYTLHEYGTVNGRVVHGPEPFEAPPQVPRAWRTADRRPAPAPLRPGLRTAARIADRTATCGPPAHHHASAARAGRSV